MKRRPLKHYGRALLGLCGSVGWRTHEPTLVTCKRCLFAMLRLRVLQITVVDCGDHVTVTLRPRK